MHSIYKTYHKICLCTALYVDRVRSGDIVPLNCSKLGKSCLLRKLILWAFFSLKIQIDRHQQSAFFRKKSNTDWEKDKLDYQEQCHSHNFKSKCWFLAASAAQEVTLTLIPFVIVFFSNMLYKAVRQSRGVKRGKTS